MPWAVHTADHGLSVRATTRGAIFVVPLSDLGR
jgi:hypothetical protein